MNPGQELPSPIRRAYEKRLLKRLPWTFRPYFNEQIREWETLFPYERQVLLDVLSYLVQLNDEQLADLFGNAREMETRMGVSRWPLSMQRQTLVNASLLARSPYYREWRQEVQKVFDQIQRESEASGASAGGTSENRLVLLILPRSLPIDPEALRNRWRGVGRELQIDFGGTGGEGLLMESLFGGVGPRRIPGPRGLLEVLAERSKRSTSDVWALDAGANLAEFFLNSGSAGGEVPRATLLSFERLKPFRELFMEQIRTMLHELSYADAVYDRLARMNFTPVCPPEVEAHLTLTGFVRSLFLTGNGAPLFGNSFVEWAAAEAFRRARPSVLIAHFGTRNKPKPFTSVAVFENQEAASPLPSAEDLPGSAVDAEILAHYVWLSATRYSEYQRALCLCLAESIPAAYVVEPADSPLRQESHPISLAKISGLLSAWLA